MLNYLKVRLLFEEEKFSKMDFYKYINMTSKGFNDMLDNQRMKVETLEKIASYFDKPMSWFFDEDVDVVENDYKEKYFELLEKYSLLLENKLKKDSD